MAIAAKVRLAASTVHRILVACRINRLGHIERATGESIRRYDMHRPSELVHIDSKKLGNIPDGGGWKKHGRGVGERNSQAHRDSTRPRKVTGRPNLAYCYVHSAIDA